MQNTDPIFLPVFRKQCTTCAHLVKHAPTALEECHFSKGNTDCPAKTIYIGVGVNIEKASNGIAAAIINGDAVALSRLATKLAGFEADETTQVLAKVRELCLNSYKIIINADGELEDISDNDEEESADEEEDGEGDESQVDEEAASDAAFDDEAFIALIDARIKLALSNGKPKTDDRAAPEMEPVRVETAAGAEIAANTPATIVIDGGAQQNQPAGPTEAAEDDWTES